MLEKDPGLRPVGILEEPRSVGLQGSSVFSSQFVTDCIGC